MGVDGLKPIVTLGSSCDGRSDRQRWTPPLPPITKTALLPSFLSYKEFARHHNWSRSRASDPQHLHRLHQRNTNNPLHPSFNPHRYALASVPLPCYLPSTFLSAHSTTRNDTAEQFRNERSPSPLHNARLYYEDRPPQHSRSPCGFAIPHPSQFRALVPRHTKHLPLSSPPGPFPSLLENCPEKARSAQAGVTKTAFSVQP